MEDDGIIRPKNAIAREKAEADAKTAAEQKTKEDDLMMEAYADYLDELKVNSPDEYKKVIDDMMAASGASKMEGGLKTPSGIIGKDGKKVDGSVPSIEIEPKPGFVVKTKNPKGPEGEDAKVFINICCHEAIKNFSKRVQLMEDGTEQEGLSVPCSVGPPRSETDRAGKPAVVFDVIVNPQVIKDAKEDVSGSTRHWLIEIALDRIDNKYKTQLDRRYKLPKAKYKGSVAKQRIRAVEKPKIEPVMLGEDNKNKTSKKKQKKNVKKVPSKPKLPLEYCKYTLSYSDTMSTPGTIGTDEDEETWSVCPIPGDGSLPNPCASELDLDIIPAQLRLSVPLPRLATVRSLDGDGGSSFSSKVQQDRVGVEISPWMVVVKAESYHAVEVMLPYPVFCTAESTEDEDSSSNNNNNGNGNDGNDGSDSSDSITNSVGVGGTAADGSHGASSSSSSSSSGGSFFDCVYDSKSRTLHVVLTVDTTALDFDPAPRQDGTMSSSSNHVGPDPGSRPWLLSQAINDRSRPSRPAVGVKEDDAADQLAADDDDVFAEDAFHNMDAMSQHFNMQKEQGRKDKEMKQAAKEAEEAKAAKLAAEEEKRKMLEDPEYEEKRKKKKAEEESKLQKGEGEDSFAKALERASKPAKKTKPVINIDRKPVEGLSLANEDGVDMENDLIFDLC